MSIVHISEMQFGILGPLEVRADGREVPLGGVKPRALLAVLALHANQPVGAERLAVALWGEDVPPSAVKTIQVYVARLRRALADPDVLVSTPAGYCLRVRPGELDAEHFERRVADGREALAAGRNEHAAAELREALGLWRGPPLAELASLPFAPAEIARLEEQRLAAIEVRVEADLAMGRHAELVGELQQLTIEHPWRERLHGQLMLALYRGRRQADALEAFRHARDVLVEQLGIEPGAELHDLQQAILAHDPALAGPALPPILRGARSLPASPNRTVGRAREIAAIADRLLTGSVRLLTLTGPGGVGKTRLALETARTVEMDFADGACFVSIADVLRHEDVPAAIVRALEIVALPGEPSSEAVNRFLATKQLLLVVDNFEHLLSAAPFISDLLGRCPRLVVLATSREPLRLLAEELFPVPPLSAPRRGSPDDAEALVSIASVALFGERARARDPWFQLSGENAEAVAEICRRVDGLPLAIELAAGRCGLLSAREIATRLDVSLGAPGAGARDAPSRQQTLRATVDWSHALLDVGEQACFARFAVFSGGATVSAAEAVTDAGLETLERLVAKSMLVRHPGADGSTRISMLETIAAYARERLAAAADAEVFRECHHRYYLALAQRHGSTLWGSDRRTHLAVLDAEVANLEAALRWAAGRLDAERTLALCAALGSYWLMRDRYAHAVDWFDQALALPGAAAHPGLRVQVLCRKLWCLWPIGRGDEQAAVGIEAEAIARGLDEPLLLSQALATRAEYEAVPGRLDTAGALADEALAWARASGDEFEIASATCTAAIAAPTSAERRVRVDHAASLLQQLGCSWLLAELLASSAWVALREGSDDEARELAARAVPVARELDDRYIWMWLLGTFGLANLMTGEIDAAGQTFREELVLCRELVVLPMATEGLLGMAAVAAVQGDLRRAACLVGAAGAHRHGQAEADSMIEARLDAAFFESARIRCGWDVWSASARVGAALSFEDAIAYALEATSG